VSHVGTTSVVFETAICDGDTVLSRARVLGVFWDGAAGRPAPPHEDFRRGLLSAMPDRPVS